MAINKNHEFEELDGIKCIVVERNVPPERAMFLKDILFFNGCTVVLAPAPPPKPAPIKAPVPAADGDTSAPPPEPASIKPPETFTLGVTNLMFNVTNAIFGRTLKTKNGHVVTQAYWNQREESSHDEMPYYEHTALKG